jgi:hypothetical protein
MSQLFCTLHDALIVLGSLRHRPSTHVFPKRHGSAGEHTSPAMRRRSHVFPVVHVMSDGQSYQALHGLPARGLSTQVPHFHASVWQYPDAHCSPPLQGWPLTRVPRVAWQVGDAV